MWQFFSFYGMILKMGFFVNFLNKIVHGTEGYYVGKRSITREKRSDYGAYE